MSQRWYCGTTVQAEAQGPTDRRAFSRKWEGFEMWRPSWISFHHPTSHGLLFRVTPILARDLKKVDGMGSIQFAFLFRHSVIGDTSCPFINAIFYKSTRTGQKWTIPIYSHTGRWSRGWWDHCSGCFKLFFSSLLLDVIINQNPIIINSTNLFTGEWRRDKEMWW
jgi:hypothetical protein